MLVTCFAFLVNPNRFVLSLIIAVLFSLNLLKHIIMTMKKENPIVRAILQSVLYCVYIIILLQRFSLCLKGMVNSLSV